MERSKPKAKGKSEKLFRFQSFTERIAAIKINVVLQTRSTSGDVLDESETFFGTGLQKWRELNCTSSFIEFHAKVAGRSNSLPQLIHHKDEILADLLVHLRSSDTLAHEPLLDLVVQLARDLQGDFYPYFSSVFPVLVSVCLRHDPQLIQNGFSAIAHIFKFLWRHMLKDIENVYSLYSELLVQSQKPHIRQFAAESFGFLLRKVRDQEKLLEMIFTSLLDNPELVEGVGQLIFEVCKGVPKQFHSCAEKVLRCSLEQLTTLSPSASPDLVFSGLSHTIRLMAEHTRREFSSPLWTPLLLCLEGLVRQWRECPESIPLSRNLVHVLHLVGVAVAWRKGSRIRDSGKIVKILEEILSSSFFLTNSLLFTSLHLVTSLMLVDPHVTECHTHFPRLLRLLCYHGGNEEVETVLKCFRELSEKYPSFLTNILPYCVKYCDMVCGSEENHTHVIHFLAELSLTFDPKWPPPDSGTPAGNIRTLQPSPGSGNFILQVERRTRSGSGLKQLVGALEGVVRGAGVVGVVSGEGAGPQEGGRSCEDLSTTWAALVCVEHLSHMPATLSEAVTALLSSLNHTLQKTTPTVDTRDHAHSEDHTHHQQHEQQELQLLWSQAVTSLTCHGSPLPLSWDLLLPLLKCWSCSPLVLTAVEAYLKQLNSPPPPPSSTSSSLSTQQLPPFSDILLLCLPNLSSPSSHVRVLTLKVLAQCLLRDSGNAGCDTANASGTDSDAIDVGELERGRLAEVIEVCLNAEQIPAILTKYREKLLWMEKLKYNPRTLDSLPSSAQEIPLRFLIGSLYVNFSLLWDPIKHLIISYAVDKRRKQFWDVFGHFLENSSIIFESSPTSFAPPSESLNWHDSIPALFWYQNGLVCGMERGRPDHVNFRRLLWDCLSDIPSFAEPRSRILVPLFLQFIEKEYVLREDNMMEFQDLRRRPEDDSVEEEREEGAKDGEEEEEEEEELVVAEREVGDVTIEEEVEEEEEREKGEDSERKSSDMKKRKKKPKETEKKQTGSKGLTKILLGMLRVFSKFQNPKVLYRQEDLHNLYMKLLTHRDTEVQQLSIDCLLTYKPPHLAPYHESLGRLLENATFREELLNFNTDSESCVVSEEHRTGLMPILLRILYGRIQRPVGVAMSRVGVASRRMAVLQFLAGCEEREMQEFFSLLLLPFRTLLDSSEEQRPKVDIGRVIPLRKQLGFLRMLSMILAVLGPRVRPHLPTFLSLLLALVHHHQTILDHSRHLIQPVFVGVVRNLRQLVIARLIECFKTFTDFDFLPFEERIFGAVVWPQLVKLPNESIQHPTPLMRLLTTWSKFPRYHKLLGQPVPNHLHLGSPRGSNTSPGGQEFPRGAAPILHYVYRCLFSPGVSGRVTGCVMEMTLDLLEGGEEEGGEGVRLVLGHVPTLLSYLGDRVRSKCEKAAEVEGGNLQLEFNVLSKISNYVKDSVECATLASLLVPFVSANKYKKQQESVLVTLKNLLASVEDANSFFRPLSKFFGELTVRKNRKLLCEIFEVLAEKDPRWKRTAEIVSMVNEWDSRHIEEPAYEARQEGYAAARELLSLETGWTVDCVLPILHNAMFTLNTSSEMSLRDAASFFVTTLLSHIQTDSGEKFQFLVMNVVMTAVKKGLRSKHEFTRLEFIAILSSLVKHYPCHPRFIDMATHLASDDKEVDFFENVCHLQLHRQTKAMRKLAVACRSSQLSPHSMTGFLAPLANQVLFHSTSNVEQNLLTESVNVISGMCLQLKWTKYCYFLRHYLRLLTKKSEVHKTLIRVVVGILDSFHFDVSGVDSDELGDSEREGGGEGEREREKEQEPVEKASSRPEEEMEEEMEEGEEEEEAEKISQSLSLQRKIHNTIVRTILPSLAAILTKGSSPSAAHKLSSKSKDHEANMLRVPVAMAMTKLLLHLPQSTLTAHLPSLLLKVCETLKSRSQDARDAARDTLVKMAVALGPAFLPYIFKEMKELLTRGYQLHVLAYSLHSVLNGVRPILKTGDLDPCLDLMSQVLVEDLFGVPAEEREAGESVAKIPEGKNPQSSKSYCIMAQFLSPRLLPQLLSPVKEILETKASSKTSHVAEEVLRQIGYGILSNDGLTAPALLVFVHGLVSNAVPRLSTTKPHPPHVVMAMSCSALRRPEDCRLIPKEPGRARPKPASQSNVAAHVITEFGLQVLRAAFKKGKFDSSSTEQLQMLDPFLPLLTLSLSSRHTKVLTHSLHCLLPLLRLSLPSLTTSVHRVVAALFGVLRKYARSGEMSGTNRELVVAAFKAITVVLRDVKQSQISEDELKLLLRYVEEDIHDYRRQITAFPLLRAILGRKFVVEDVHKLIYKVAQLSVTSDSDTTRLQCRQAVVHYIMDYPLGKKLKRILDFYVCNLSYEDQNGRESVVEFFSHIFSKFPDLLIHRYSSFFFLPLSAQLANDDSPTCKRMIAETLSSLFKRLNTAAMNDVITMVKTWLSHPQLSHKKLAVQLVGLLAESLGQSFEAHLPTFLPLLSHCLLLQHHYPDNEEEEPVSMTTSEPVSMATEESVSMENSVTEVGHREAGDETDILTENGVDSDNLETLEDESETERVAAPDERSLDHFLFGVVHVLCKLLTSCVALRSPVHRTVITTIMEQVETLLLHPHAWVRLSSCQLFGHLFAAYKPQDLVSPKLTGEEGEDEAAAVSLSREKERGKGGGRKRKRRSGVGVAGGVVSTEYLLKDSIIKVPELCHKFCVQLSSRLLTPELANQAVKNLVFLAKVLHRMMQAGHMTSHSTDHMTLCEDLMTIQSRNTTTNCNSKSESNFGITEDQDKPGTTDDHCDQHSTTDDHYDEHDHCGSSRDHSGHRTVRDLHWLVGRMDRLARQEAGKEPHQSLKRTSVLQWMAALSLDLGPTHLPSYLPVLLATPYRELTDTDKRAGEELHTLAVEVVEVMKETCGKEEFARAYSAVHRMALDTREKRKKHAALEAVINPERAIRRRQRKHLLTRASKRRRILTHRPSASTAAKRFRHRTRK